MFVSFKIFIETIVNYNVAIKLSFGSPLKLTIVCSGKGHVQ